MFSSGEAQDLRSKAFGAFSKNGSTIDFRDFVMVIDFNHCHHLQHSIYEGDPPDFQRKPRGEGEANVPDVDVDVDDHDDGEDDVDVDDHGGDEVDVDD